MAKVLPQSLMVRDEYRAKQKAWVRDAAIQIVRHLRADQPLNHEEVRRQLTFVAVDWAVSVWDQVEGRFMEAPQNETGENDVG
jgi:hypothetical protein